MFFFAELVDAWAGWSNSASRTNQSGRAPANFSTLSAIAAGAKSVRIIGKVIRSKFQIASCAFDPSGKSRKPESPPFAFVQSWREKYFAFPETKSGIYLRPSHPGEEGRVAIVRSRGVGCGGRGGVVGRTTLIRLCQGFADGYLSPSKDRANGLSRTAKSCGPGAPTLASSLR